MNYGNIALLREVTLFDIAVLTLNRRTETVAKNEIWVFLFAIGAMLFSWPLMSIFKDDLIPYLFVVWLLFIAITAVTSIFSERDGGRL